MQFLSTASVRSSSRLLLTLLLVIIPSVRNSHYPTFVENKAEKHEEFNAGPRFPLNAQAHDSELLQVNFMEFELVRPNLVHFQAAACPSEDSGVLEMSNHNNRNNTHSESLDLPRDTNSYPRPDSPTMSISSSGCPSLHISGSESVATSSIQSYDAPCAVSNIFSLECGSKTGFL